MPSIEVGADVRMKRHAALARIEAHIGTFEIETAQMRDLVSNGSFGRGATALTLLQHRITLPASRNRRWT